MAGASDVLGGTYTPHCAAIHPARLARGLAEAVRRAGRRGLRADAGPGDPAAAGWSRRRGRCGRGTWSGPPRATRRSCRAWSGRIAPVYSLMIATEPLPEAVWAQIGLAGRPTFGDLRHLIIYGQRTADGRLAFGGRGAPYHLGSAIRPSFDRVPAVFEALRRTLGELFPVAGRRAGHAPLGRPARHPPRLVRLGRAGPARPDWPGRAATSATGCRRRTWPGRTLADLITGGRQRAGPAAVGRAPVAAAGSRSRCAGWA